MTHQTDSRLWDAELVPTESGRTDAPEPDCPVEVALAAISGRWTTLVLRDLMLSGSSSYSDLSRSLPHLSDKVLAQRLDDLVSGGFVAREVIAGYPRRTRYHLTRRGDALRPLLIELYRTGIVLQNLDPQADR